MLRLLYTCIGTEANFLSYGPDVIQYLGASYDYGIFLKLRFYYFWIILCFKWFEIIAKKVPLCITELIVSLSIPVFQLLLLDSQMLKLDREEDSAK
jgi:hypothetical protein